VFIYFENRYKMPVSPLLAQTTDTLSLKMKMLSRIEDKQLLEI